MARRSFDAAPPPTPPADGDSFTLGGREWHLLPFPPPGAIDRATSLPPVPSPDAPGYEAAVAGHLGAAVAFLRDCLTIGQRDAFDALIVSGQVTGDVIVDVYQWVAEQYAARVRAGQIALDAYRPPPPPAPEPVVAEPPMVVDARDFNHPQDLDAVPDDAVVPLAQVKATARRMAQVMLAGGAIDD